MCAPYPQSQSHQYTPTTAGTPRRLHRPRGHCSHSRPSARLGETWQPYPAPRTAPASTRTWLSAHPLASVPLILREATIKLRNAVGQQERSPVPRRAADVRALRVKPWRSVPGQSQLLGLARVPGCGALSREQRQEERIRHERSSPHRRRSLYPREPCAHRRSGNLRGGQGLGLGRSPQPPEGAAWPGPRAPVAQVWCWRQPTRGSRHQKPRP
mmetsp:Transcript_6527/g.19134  ORF Transcript_6527/g.19134 Transcript_6527/m.19134 type:complete len:213 (-) Transcript_6527:160-798(-)